MKILSYHFCKGGFWIRVFGIGFSIMDKNIHRPLFSERNGHRKVLRIGKYGIELLRQFNK